MLCCGGGASGVGDGGAGGGGGFNRLFLPQALLELYMVSLQHDDIHAATYVQTTFIHPQVEKIFTISQYITNLERVGPGLGEYMFDKLPQN